ncbi:hypothetical protein SDC9_122158 [bioreactor metagenome]|uniref:Uncharacterized protein n=1 Tax=bioreactor metagenome TaxID=1076179 RepID=A0A645CDZ0_9ZZZZ
MDVAQFGIPVADREILRFEQRFAAFGGQFFHVHIQDAPSDETMICVTPDIVSRKCAKRSCKTGFRVYVNPVK